MPNKGGGPAREAPRTPTLTRDADAAWQAFADSWERAQDDELGPAGAARRARGEFGSYLVWNAKAGLGNRLMSMISATLTVRV